MHKNSDALTGTLGFPSLCSPPSGLDFQYPCLMQLRGSISTSNPGLLHNSWGEPLSPPGCSLFPAQLSLLSHWWCDTAMGPAANPSKYLTPSTQSWEKPKLPDINSSHFPLRTLRVLHTSNYPLSSRKVKVLVTQVCPTLCGPMDSGPPGSSVHGILRARILECCHFLLQGIFLTHGSNQVSCITGRFSTIWVMSSWNPAQIWEEWLSFSSPKLSFHLALASFPLPNPGDKLLVSSRSLTPFEISFSLLMGQSLTYHKPNQVQPLSILWDKIRGDFQKYLKNGNSVLGSFFFKYIQYLSFFSTICHMGYSYRLPDYS